MIELGPNQILIHLSAAHLDECYQWQQQIEDQWRQAQAQRQSAHGSDPQQRLIPQRGGAIGGAFTYTIRPQTDGYHLSVKDAISEAERDWSASSDCADLMIFAVLHEREYGLLWQWFAQSEGDSFDRWVQTQLEYQLCNNTLGRIIKVRDLSTGVQLDLTDYEGW